ncbi:hypothetical protein KM043_008136 [Ampulex compressa]|nr:hypothetical protein KM043_008136 [Ampulex compressa]
MTEQSNKENARSQRWSEGKARNDPKIRYPCTELRGWLPSHFDLHRGICLERLCAFLVLGGAMNSAWMFLLFASASTSLPTKSRRGHAVPPKPRFEGVFDETHDKEKIASRINSWTPDEVQNVWEWSGLHEGDIMLHPKGKGSKNGLLDSTSRWPAGIVPYYIEEDDFDQEDIEVIQEAIEEYQNKTCLRFRPYKKSDVDYVTIQGRKSGCWSLVGRHGKGQVLNLQKPGCVHRGVVVHEFMHALGFYHQQSAADRDDWVKIHWDNIKSGKEHNFNKYDKSTVTDYGVGYDYKSVMHYSSHAFSKNGEPTITPRKEKTKLGQREGLSEKDTLKVQAMYREECEGRTTEGSVSEDSAEDISLTWILS